MGTLSKPLKIAGCGIGTLLDEPRFYLALLLPVAFAGYHVSTWWRGSLLTGQPFSIFEPIIHFFSNRYMMVVYFNAFFLVLCDAPFLTPFDGYLLMRSSRAQWYFGKCLQVILFSLLYIAVVILLTLLCALPFGYFGNLWSVVGQRMTQDSFGVFTGIIMPLPGGFLKSFRPATALLLSAGLWWLYSCMLSLAALAANLYLKRWMGTTLVMAVNLIGIIKICLNQTSFIGWHPASNVLLQGLRTDIFWGTNSYGQALLILIGVGALFALIGYVKVRHYDLVIAP